MLRNLNIYIYCVYEFTSCASKSTKEIIITVKKIGGSNYDFDVDLSNALVCFNLISAYAAASFIPVPGFFAVN